MAVSVQRFIHDNPALFKATAGFVLMFKNLQDPVVAITRRCKSPEEKVGWILLGTALFQHCSYGEFAKLMRSLHEKFPEDALWKLPVPKEDEISSCVESVFNTRSWPLFQHAPGIFWSVGAFMRNHGVQNPNGIANYLASRTAEELWRDLGEIYFMGKSSPRPKACAAIYRLTSDAPIGLGLQCRPSDKRPHLPLTMGARRYISILGPASSENGNASEGFAKLSSKEKQALSNQLFVALGQELNESPYLAAHSLQYFLENGKDGFICKQITKKCKECPLYKFCNYSEKK